MADLIVDLDDNNPDSIPDSLAKCKNCKVVGSLNMKVMVIVSASISEDNWLETTRPYIEIYDISGEKSVDF